MTTDSGAQSPGKERTRTLLLRLYLCGFIAAALMTLFYGIYDGTEARMGGHDLQYSTTRLLRNGLNPYDVWLHGHKKEFFSFQLPNYLPNLMYLLMPLTWLDWPTARDLWVGVNLALAGYLAWRLYASQRMPGQDIALLLPLFFLTSAPMAESIYCGQHSLLILAATAWALSHPSAPLRSGFALSISMAKYSFGAFFLALELARRRIAIAVVAVGFVLASYVALALQTHSPFNLHLLMGPLDTNRTALMLVFPFKWLNHSLGWWALPGLALLGVGTIFVRGIILSASEIPPAEVNAKLVFGATCFSLVCAPHLDYDFVFIILPLTVGGRLSDYRKFERSLYIALLVYHWNLYFPIMLLFPRLTLERELMTSLATLLLGCLFLSKRRNWIPEAPIYSRTQPETLPESCVSTLRAT